MIKKLTLTVLLLYLAASLAGALTFYIDAVNGDNARTATQAQSPSTPWQTITHALNYLGGLVTHISATIVVAPGTYNTALGETFPLQIFDYHLVSSATHEATLRGNGDVIVMTLGSGRQGQLEGFRLGGEGGLNVVKTNAVLGGGHAVIKNNIVDAGGYNTGINVAGPYQLSASLEGNVISNTISESTGISLETSGSCEVELNDINCRRGITAALTDTFINKNTIRSHSGTCVYAATGSLITGRTVTVKNCILYGSDAKGIYQDGTGGACNSNYNDLYGFAPSFTYVGSVEDKTGDIAADPQFVDLAGNDLHLQATSPCIDAGDPDPIYNDPDGSRADMGAYPFFHVPPTTTTTTVTTVTTTTMTTSTTVPGGFTLLSKTTKPLAGAPFSISFSFDQPKEMTLFIYAQQVTGLPAMTPVKTVAVSAVRGKNTVNWAANGQGEYFTDQGQAAPPGLYYFELRDSANMQVVYFQGTFLIAATK